MGRGCCLPVPGSWGGHDWQLGGRAVFSPAGSLPAVCGGLDRGHLPNLLHRWAAAPDCPGSAHLRYCTAFGANAFIRPSEKVCCCKSPSLPPTAPGNIWRTPSPYLFAEEQLGVRGGGGRAGRRAGMGVGDSGWESRELVSLKALEFTEERPEGSTVLLPSTLDEHLPGLLSILPDLSFYA